MRTTLALSIVLSLGLSACSGGDPKEAGYGAFQSGDYPAAVSSFDEALAGLASDSPDYFELSIARCQSLAHVDPGRAEASFREIAASHPDAVGVKQYSLIASELLGANANVNAVNVVDMGVKAFPDDAKMAKLLENVKEAAVSDPAAMDALKGMGYLGGE